jgi:hypothetical protein
MNEILHPLYQATDAAMADAIERGLPGFVPLGDTVLCDDCDTDYTASQATGGILFQSKALGPCCAPEWEESARKYGEEHFIRGRCPEGVSFAGWVRSLRGPDAAITIEPGRLR